ncbi:MAG: pyruvate, phosphate dikinase [Gemmatimonadetes bacterium]|nr:MAG: pyruvate, phosphate dikinase [Gemmatimonadota bacterium]PYP81915.1 MAG: pyruvate, phosphate dikinase [Gemmatimonadota bacterium]
MPALERWVYSFGDGRADGSAAMRDILGGKGAGLAEMANLGLPVPPGFTISAKLCITYLEQGTFPDDLREEVDRHLKQLERLAKKRFGDAHNPLLVSVRSGAAVSMPGMMETILNLGLNDETVQGLIAGSKNPRFAYDSYRRFVQMYGDVVFDLGKEPFAEVLEEFKRRRKVERDIDLPADDLKALVREFKSIIQAKCGLPFPEDPTVQLWGAIAAVFKSWRTRRAADYRRVHGIPDDLGTAVNVVAMVYGNMGDDSGTGVAFTRDCSTGEAVLNGDVLTNAQGEDVVSGVRTPESLAKLKRGKLAKVYRELERIAEKLERHFRDVQDIEFTFEHGNLYMLQTRRAQRAGLAAVRSAVEMVEEGLITPSEAVQRVPPQDLDQLFHPMVDPRASVTLVAKGLPASPGAATGEAVFDADEAEALAHEGRKVILIRPETSPEDFHGIVAAQAVITARGGMTSHAAVVARGMGKTCVVGAKDIEVDPAAGRLRANGRVVKWGQLITVDGTTGRVLLGAAKLVEPKLGSHYAKLMAWADEHRRLRVRANADTPADAKRAREFGAEGIGLCRTEHMFFEGDRITAMREMIVAPDEAGRRRALAKLLPMQREDFEGIFEAMAGLPVTIRLLDPPLHEFLPHGKDELGTLARAMKLPAVRLERLVASLVEANPMLGHRGCRLGITYPEITEMQARAIFEAACRVVSRGRKVTVEVMIPLVALVEELRRQTEIVRRVAREVFQAEGRAVPYLVGTMIELPRAALTADEIAKDAEFFSFGTNDLTQTTFGLSRDDAGRFLPFYVEHGILKDDPFQVLDQEGVGKLIELAVRLGRGSRGELKIGICGEHGGEPASVKFCHHVGMNYVSCSPFRVPIARLAAAQAALEEQGVINRTRATV